MTDITIMLLVLALAVLGHTSLSRDVQVGHVEPVSFLVRLLVVGVLLDLAVWTGGLSSVLLSVLVLITLVGVLAVAWVIRTERAPEDISGLEDIR